jgi:hypothetical protein
MLYKRQFVLSRLFFYWKSALISPLAVTNGL